jgi:hypothetical protein
MEPTGLSRSATAIGLIVALLAVAGACRPALPPVAPLADPSASPSSPSSVAGPSPAPEPSPVGSPAEGPPGSPPHGIDCVGDEWVDGTFDPAEGARGSQDDPVEIVRGLYPLRPTDILEAQGPTPSAMAFVAVFRDARLIAYVELTSDGHGGWLQTRATTCPAEVLGRTFSFDVDLHWQGAVIPLTVTDSSGLVANVTLDVPPDATMPPLYPGLVAVNPAGRRDVLVLGWLGGVCDERIDVAIGASAEPGGLDISLTESSRASTCVLIGIGHTVTLWLTSEVDAAAVDLVPAADPPD